MPNALEEGRVDQTGDAPPVGRPHYLRAAVTARMLTLFVVLATAAVGCGLLGVWQLDRARERGELAAAQEAAREAADDVGPVPLVDVLAPQSSFRGDLVSLEVTVAGEFRGEDLLVADRVVGGRTGFLVLSPLWVEVPDGEAVVAVVRGWVPDLVTAAALDPAPEGEVNVVGHLRGPEASGRATMPEGQVDAISAAELVNRWGGPIWSGYLLAAEIDPPQDAGLVIAPVPPEESGLNLQNLAYALQWWIFGGFALAVWLRLVRDEARAAVTPAP